MLKVSITFVDHVKHDIIVRGNYLYSLISRPMKRNLETAVLLSSIIGVDN